MNLNNLKIGARLALGFGAMVAIMLAIVFTATLSLDGIRSAVDKINHDRYPKLKQAGDIIEAVNLQARAARTLLLTDVPAVREEQLKSIETASATVTANFDKLSATVRSVEGKGLLDAMAKARGDYIQDFKVFLDQVHQGDMAKAREQLLNKVREHQHDYFKAMEAFMAFQERKMEEGGADVASAVNRTEIIMMASAVMAALLAAAAGWIVTRSVTVPVRESVAALQRLAAGDLTVQVNSTRSDELGQVLASIDSTVVALRSVVGEVRSGIDSVTTASSQIAAGNTDLSSRTEQQASSLQETASSMEQLTSTVKASSDNARQANQLAVAASEAATHGGEAVGAVVETMNRISSSSKRIAEIIGVIDGIAFQTNILALNAAVEAARAGEQGRGFAVVASEVRNLAQRSAEAAKQIKTLIGESVERVEVGSRQVADAGATMSDLVQQVKKVTDLIGEISSAAVEQSSGIGQVNTAVSQMDQVTQQNAALVEESAAAAQSLEHQAQRLAQAVSVFKLGREEGAHFVAA